METDQQFSLMLALVIIGGALLLEVLFRALHLVFIG
ncbi:hypothetical protein J3D56_004195 [Erwinia persicina]|jgi:hypothetical protein|nr:hypothetical protein [Erwinia persicina]